MQLDALTFWRKRRATLIALKSRDPLADDWDADLADAERELAQLDAPAPKPKPDVKPLTLKTVIDAITPALKAALASRDARIAALEERLSNWRHVGTWNDTVPYKEGNHVQYSGHTWVALQDNKAMQPGEKSEGVWRLTSRRGRDGRDAGR